MTFPLMFKIFKPQKRLKPEDIYKTKIQLAQEIIQELQAFGFGESYPFVRLLDELGIHGL